MELTIRFMHGINDKLKKTASMAAGDIAGETKSAGETNVHWSLQVR